MTEKDNSSSKEIPTLIFNLNDFLQSKEAESAKIDNVLNELKKEKQDTQNMFFKVPDKHGLSKTDLEPEMIMPLAMFMSFAENPLPLYNAYLKRKFLSIDGNEEEDFKPYDFPILKNFVSDYMIQALISKSRLGRGEGKTILSSINDKIAKIKEFRDNLLNPNLYNQESDIMK